MVLTSTFQRTHVPGRQRIHPSNSGCLGRTVRSMSAREAAACLMPSSGSFWASCLRSASSVSRPTIVRRSGASFSTAITSASAAGSTIFDCASARTRESGAFFASSARALGSDVVTSTVVLPGSFPSVSLQPGPSRTTFSAQPAARARTIETRTRADRAISHLHSGNQEQPASRERLATFEKRTVGISGRAGAAGGSLRSGRRRVAPPGGSSPWAPIKGFDMGGRQRECSKTMRNGIVLHCRHGRWRSSGTPSPAPPARKPATLDGRTDPEA